MEQPITQARSNEWNSRPIDGSSSRAIPPGATSQTEDPQFPVAISRAEQQGRGTHVDVSTAAVTANAPNREGAVALLEWLATDGQKQFADANFEYPANPKEQINAIVAGWGTFTAGLAAVRRLGELNRRVSSCGRRGFRR